jgi:hypothetical protein
MSLQIAGGSSNGRKVRSNKAKATADRIFAERKAKIEKELKGLTAEAVQKWNAFGLCARKSLHAYWAAGRVLDVIRERIKSVKKYTGLTWAQWCANNNIAEASAAQAIIVATSLPHEDIDKLDGITAAKRACGIVKDKKITVKSHTRAAQGTTSELPPTHEPETMLRRLVQVNTFLATLGKLPIGEDRVAVNQELSKAIETLSSLLGNEVKVAA